MKKINKRGFTLIELLVVIAIIGLLSTLAVVALNNARAKSRDAKRIADIKQIQTALELYYNECNGYPVQVAGLLTTATDYGDGTTDCASDFGTFMQQIPEAPTPIDGTACDTTNNPYLYVSCEADGGTCDGTKDGTMGASYALEFCLGSDTGQISAGNHWATPAGITDSAGSSGL